MSRDELIEELKKAPADSEVHVKVLMVIEGGKCRRTETDEVKIQRIQTIPKIILECE